MAAVDIGFDRQEVLTFALGSRSPANPDVADAHDQVAWWQSARLAGIGALAGLTLGALTFGVVRGVPEQELYAIAWNDRDALLLVVLLIAAAGASAAILPARRVLAIEPQDVLVQD